VDNGVIVLFSKGLCSGLIIVGNVLIAGVQNNQQPTVGLHVFNDSSKQVPNHEPTVNRERFKSQCLKYRFPFLSCRHISPLSQTAYRTLEALVHLCSSLLSRITAITLVVRLNSENDGVRCSSSKAFG